MSLLDSNHKSMVVKNRKYLEVIIECLVFTAQQNIAQRGHEESRTHIGQVSDVNRGNFLELLHLRCKDLPWLEQMLDFRLNSHDQWTSPNIQNELLTIVSDFVLEKLLADVRSSGVYGIIIDETSDMSRTEQVAICLSYLVNGIKREAFIGFFATKATDGRTLYELVKRVINQMNLQLANIVGECFDGAANMKGVKKGLATLMKETSPRALYVHCYGHLLNLALQDTMENIEPLRNALGTIQNLYNFLEASPKRHAIFGDTEVESDHLILSLKSQSITRWSCRYEAVKAVTEQLERIVKTLLKLSDDKDSKTYSDARALLTAIADFEFVFGLSLLKVILSNTCSLSRFLQGKNVDVGTARRTANATITTLQSCREELHFENLWEITEKVSTKMEMWIQNTIFSFRKPAALRIKKPSRRLQALVGEHSGVPLTLTAKSHYRVSIFYLALDKVIAELESRFVGNDQDVLCGLGDLVMNSAPSLNNFDLVAKYYGLDKDILFAEHEIYKNYKSDNNIQCSNATDVLSNLHDHHLIDFVPEFAQVVKILCAIPATSCSAERSFSALRRIKTYLRSTMGQDRLNHLALINIERSYANAVIETDISRIIDAFASRKNRRCQFF